MFWNQVKRELARMFLNVREKKKIKEGVGG